MKGTQPVVKQGDYTGSPKYILYFQEYEGLCNF